MTGPLALSLLVALSCSVLVGSEKLPVYDPDDYRTGEAEDWKHVWRELLQSILPDRTVSSRQYGRRAALGLPGKRAEPTMEPHDGGEFAVMERSVRRRVPLFGFPGKRMSWNVPEEEKKSTFSLPGKRGEETQDDLVPEDWAFPEKSVFSIPSRRAPSMALPGKR